MEPAFDYPVTFNDFLKGKWRLTIQWDFYDQGKHEIECYRWYGDVVEL
jgi:hypothetical protein